MGKLLALDLDGTTVNRFGQLGALTIQALRQAREAGHIICFATGRRDMDMFSFWDQTHYADYLLLNNGGKLMRTRDRQVIFNHSIPPQTAKELIGVCLENHWQLHIMSGDYWGVNKWNPGLQEYVEVLGTAPQSYSALEQTPWKQVEGFMVTMDRREVCEYIRKHRLPLSFVPSEDACVDIMAQNIGKWKGLQQLMQLLHLTADQVVAAGDYTNDLPMIQGAGIGIAVANALQEVRNAADYVTKNDCNHDAVAEIVERFLL